MKYFFRIKTAAALARFNKACQRHEVKYFTIKSKKCWYAASEELPNILKWEGIVKFNII